ncbi:tyrosinase family oxidase copper chaperone [Streptomyces sp. NPDC048419]|uniref:tyrosinase family oxidase copper chaperone n=1 Tax=Streptomyces sp. NPDC048419 TaxID=3365547 RepID=UPI0037137320
MHLRYRSHHCHHVTATGAPMRSVATGTFLLRPSNRSGRMIGTSMKLPSRRKALLTGMTALTGAALASEANIATADPEWPGTGLASRTRRAGVAKGSTMDEPAAFDEIYLGRHIQGWPAPVEHASHHGSRQGSRRSHMGDSESSLLEFVVRIDDQDLHVMQSMDGTWLSVVNHYQTQRTPLEVARAAVRDLAGASLVFLMA